MNRLFISALALLLVSGAVACAADSEDANVPVVDGTLAPNAIAGFSTGETSGGDSFEKKAEGGASQDYLKVTLDTVFVTSY
jgi:hypothetical protein